MSWAAVVFLVWLLCSMGVVVLVGVRGVVLMGSVSGCRVVIMVGGVCIGGLQVFMGLVIWLGEVWGGEEGLGRELISLWEGRRGLSKGVGLVWEGRELVLALIKVVSLDFLVLISCVVSVFVCMIIWLICSLHEMFSSSSRSYNWSWVASISNIVEGVSLE